MKVLFEKTFGRDLKKVKNKHLLKQIKDVIEQVESVSSLNEVENLKKLQGFDSYYRIRTGDYRIGVEVIEGQIIFVCFLHRKDIYRYFPK